MYILPLDWLESEPIDYEFKYYKLLASLKTLQAQLDDNQVAPTLQEIEEHLQQLYMFKYNKNKIDSKLVVLKGINWDLMELEYERKEEDAEINDIYQLCDIAIKLFEDIYRIVIKKWRSIEEDFSVFELSKNMQHRREGFILIYTVGDNDVHSYIYEEPTNWNQNWRNFKIIHEWSNKLNVETKDKINDLVDNNRTFKCQVNKQYPLHDCIVPMAAYSFFNYLKRRG